MSKSSIRSLSVLAIAAGVLCFAATTGEAGEKRKSKKPLKVFKFDPTAKKVEMFKAEEEGLIKIKVVPNGPLGGRLLFENTTKEPLTIELPEAFVGVQVLNQLGGGGGFGGGQGGGGLGGGGGLFSIPPEKVVSVKYNSVCLEHGKADPRPSMKYKLIPVEKFTKDARIKELCKVVRDGRINAGAAQAAAWNLSNRMSWQQLATKQASHFSNQPYFSRQQVQLAQRLVAHTTGMARETAAKEKAAAKKKASKPEEKKGTRQFSR